MCGIAGVLYADPNRPIDPAVLKAMGDSIAHRGPDAEGFLRLPGVGLAHRRLSIIDLSGGDQPIGNEDGSVQVIFNGEIYNYQALRQELLGRGHKFRTNSDTETLVHAYEEHGPSFVEKLRGMFTFAIWDAPRRSLLLARDRLGIKPLYYYQDQEKLLFGSELKAILAHPGVPRSLDPMALEDYLAFGMVPGPRSILQNVKKLMPAHFLFLQAGRLDANPQRYWQLRFEPDSKPTVTEWQEAIRAKMAESARLHLIADVPVGTFLSGGIDSSIVVASTSGLTDGPLQTFSIGFNEAGFSELPHARTVSERFGTQHVEEIVTADAVSMLDQLTHHYDEPFADSSAIPTFLVARLASKSVKVVLSGDGGDEAFGGYSRYAHDLKEASLRRLLPKWLRRSLVAAGGRIYPKADWLPRPLRAKTLLTNLSLEPGVAYANTLTLCREPLRRRLLHEDIRTTLNGHRPDMLIRAAHQGAPADDALGGMLAADVAMLLPDDFLVKVDRATMAHGLEARPPLLDHELMELAARIPSDLKVRHGSTKWILKEAYRQQLPEGIIDRPKKGFEVPIDEWLLGPLRNQFETRVLAGQSRVGSLIDQAVAKSVYQKHLARTGRMGAILWSLLVLASWADRYLK